MIFEGGPAGGALIEVLPVNSVAGAGVSMDKVCTSNDMRLHK